MDNHSNGPLADENHLSRDVPDKALQAAQARFETEPPFYNNTIRPLLIPEREGDLLVWLRDAGILDKTCKCVRVFNDDTPCPGHMTWARTSNGPDPFFWRCSMCNKRMSIYEGTYLKYFKCNFRELLRVLLGWSKGVDVDSLSKLLCIRSQLITQVYNLLAYQLALKHINTNPTVWKIGGYGTVVLIDIFPDGFDQKSLLDSNVGDLDKPPILCIAEIKHVPTRYWIQVLERQDLPYNNQLNYFDLSVLQIVREMVAPGSVLVTNRDAAIGSHETLQSLKHLYPVMATVEGIERHDTHLVRSLDNLETIWRPCIDICSYAQYFNSVQYMKNYIVGQLWRRQFGDDSFEALLNEMRI